MRECEGMIMNLRKGRQRRIRGGWICAALLLASACRSAPAPSAANDPEAGARADSSADERPVSEDAIRVGDLRLSDAWARSTPAGFSAAVYLQASNVGASAIGLTALGTEIAESVEIHETRHEEGLVRMVHLPEGVWIPAGETLSFEPGGHHIMLNELAVDLEVGESFELRLAAEPGELVTIEVDVRAP